MAFTDTRMDWETHEKYWREHYKSRPYFDPSYNYDSYGPAYRFGFDAGDRYHGKQWSDVESDLSREWEHYKDRGKSTWQQMKDAVKDAWDRVTGS